MNKMPPIRGRMQGCLHAGRAEQRLPLSAMLAVGFGTVTITRGSEVLYSDDDMDKILRPFEKMARKRPGDWKVAFYGPLANTTYQRHGRNRWVLVEQGQGFA